MRMITSGLIALTGCCAAGAVTAQPMEAPITTKSGTIAAPAPGKGQIVFYRSGTIVGAAAGCNVRENGVKVAGLSRGKYYVIERAPGRYSFTAKSEVTDKLDLEVEEGETYFVRCAIGMGIAIPRSDLTPTDRASFAASAKGLKLAKAPGATD